MTSHAAVCVHDDLSTGQACIAHWPADNKVTCWVHEQTKILGIKINGCKNGFNNILANIWSKHGVQIDVSCMLAGHHDRVDAYRALILVVFDGDLGLAIWAKVRNGAVFAHCSELLGQTVSKGDWQRHQLNGVGAGIPKHQTLIAGTLTVERI
ncbi:unannotated protein [freshwater metagenome]|uniref:Unannotated protein n=1 Tax=freshwater metagenome TaxID=449393 RepID=A0A6J6MUR0_9ZZZZ